MINFQKLAWVLEGAVDNCSDFIIIELYPLKDEQGREVRRYTVRYEPGDLVEESWGGREGISDHMAVAISYLPHFDFAGLAKAYSCWFYGKPMPKELGFAALCLANLKVAATDRSLVRLVDLRYARFGDPALLKAHESLIKHS